MQKQNANTLVMVKPERFGFNYETSQTNIFQEKCDNLGNITAIALTEFENMVKALKLKGINIIVLEFGNEELPDAVFPNNWFATFGNGDIIIFPLLSQKRRLERKLDQLIKNLRGFKISKIRDFTRYESYGYFLEGTGSIVMDRVNNYVYANESSRTNKVLFDVFCSTLEISINKRFFFRSHDKKGNEIYHTNVIMSIGENFCLICDECIYSEDKERIMNSLIETKHEIIKITEEQMKKFCGNILQVENLEGEKFIIMSETAENAFDHKQIELLKKHGQIISVNIDTIEKIGGGSVRCMLGEIFLPLNSDIKNKG